ncbi:MAG TPA: hypothetical protein VN939_21190, partial [Chthoniobacterales bacterium]|nr:hypothetical protein [Chthoniobacterales bacterium]
FQPNSSKIISLRYENWSGFLTYCGIGLWNKKQTDEYAAEWLVDPTNPGIAFQDTAEKIRERGTRWLMSIHRQSGKVFPHSFVLAGYEGGAPVYAIVSNFEGLTGEIGSIL